MNNFKWLFLSTLGFLALLGSLVALGCNFAGMHDWRGNKAALLGIGIGLFGAWAVITMLFQTLKILNSPGSAKGAKYWGIVFILAIIFVGATTAGIVSKQICH